MSYRRLDDNIISQGPANLDSKKPVRLYWFVVAPDRLFSLVFTSADFSYRMVFYDGERDRQTLLLR